MNGHNRLTPLTSNTGTGISSTGLVLKLFLCQDQKKFNYDPSSDPLVRYGACRLNGDIALEPPNEGNLTVFGSFELIRISKVDQMESTLTAHLKFSMFWMDERIKTNFSHKIKANSSYDVLKLPIKRYLKNETPGKMGVPLWLPDYNFENQIMQEPVTEEFVLTGVNLLSENPFHQTLPLIQVNLDMRIVVFCNFEFSNYPLDSQNCSFIFRHDSDRCIKYSTYEYRNDSSKSPAQFEAAGFDIQVTPINGGDGCNEDLGFALEMTRIVRPFVLKSYLPTTSIVLISGISFIVPFSAIPGRVALSVTLFLTLGNIFMQTTVRKVTLYNSNFS